MSVLNGKRPLSASCLSQHWNVPVRQETGERRLLILKSFTLRASVEILFFF